MYVDCRYLQCLKYFSIIPIPINAIIWLFKINDDVDVLVMNIVHKRLFLVLSSEWIKFGIWDV